MLPPLPRCSRWAYSSLKITHPCQPSPVPRPGRPAHRPFRGLLSVHSRCGLHTRTVTVCRDRYPKASDTSSPPCLLRSLPAGAVAGWGLHPPEKRRLVTAHVEVDVRVRAQIGALASISNLPSPELELRPVQDSSPRDLWVGEAHEAIINL